MDTNKYRIGNVYISNTNISNAVEFITDSALSRRGGYICVTNMRMIRYAGKHPEYSQLMNHSLMNLPDGTPLVWCGKLYGCKEIGKTCGPELFDTMMKNGDKRIKHYLLGDTQDVLDAIVEKYTKGYGTNIVGVMSLPFTEVDNFNYEEISARIFKSNANIIWIAMTAPKQDEFSKRLYSFLPNAVSIGVGRAFRLSIGAVKKSPKWAVKMGIGGFFMRRRKWYQTGWWYFETSFFLLYYVLQILIRKLIKQKQ